MASRVDGIKVPWSLLQLPPFSDVAVKALQLANDDNAPLRKLSDLICSDPAFSGEVLTIVNSPLYALRSPISSTLQAVSMLGLERLKGVAVTVGVRSYLGSSLRRPALRGCWRHSLACALIAEEVAGICMMNKSTAYTIGMMHDIGRLALAVIQPDEYAAFLETAEADTEEILARERELFEFDHCEIGGQLATNWGLPGEFMEVASRHHEPQQPGRIDMLDVVRFSCRMADTIGFSCLGSPILAEYKDLVALLPERERNLFSPDADKLTMKIATKINSIEIV